MYRALVISNLATIHIKEGIGRFPHTAVQWVPDVAVAPGSPTCTETARRRANMPLSTVLLLYQA